MKKSFSEALANVQAPKFDLNSLEIDDKVFRDFCWQKLEIDAIQVYPLFQSYIEVSIDLQRLAQTSDDPHMDVTAPFFVWLVKSNKDMYFVVATSLPVHRAYVPQDPWVEGQQWKEFVTRIGKKLGINHAKTLEEVSEADGDSSVITRFEYMNIGNAEHCFFAYQA